MAARGRLTVLKWLWENGCPMQPDTMCHVAAENGHVDVLKWAHKEVGFPLTTQGVIAFTKQRSPGDCVMGVGEHSAMGYQNQ